MKIVKFQNKEKTSWGVLSEDTIREFTGERFDVTKLSDKTIPLKSVKLLAPINAENKNFCLGANYAKNIAEMGHTTTLPSIFIKPNTAIVGPEDCILLPSRDVSKSVQHQSELVIVIGKRARNVKKEEALDYILGYTCANDITALDLVKMDPNPTRGKGFDTFCPLGPCIETDIDPNKGVEIECTVNGVTRQKGNTSSMLRDVGSIVSFISSFTTLLPGDIILTGSPGGSSDMDDGDVVEVKIEGIGLLKNYVKLGE